MRKMYNNEILALYDYPFGICDLRFDGRRLLQHGSRAMRIGLDGVDYLPDYQTRDEEHHTQLTKASKTMFSTTVLGQSIKC